MTFEHVYVETYLGYEIHYFPLFEMHGVYLHPGASPPEGPVPLDENWRTHQTVVGCQDIIGNLVGEPVFVQFYPPPPSHVVPGWAIFQEPAGSQRLFAVDAETKELVSAFWSKDNLSGLITWLLALVPSGHVWTHQGIPVYFHLRDLEYYATVGTRTRHFYDWGFQACLDWIDKELEIGPAASFIFTSLIPFEPSYDTGDIVKIVMIGKNEGEGPGPFHVDFYDDDSGMLLASFDGPASIEPGEPTGVYSTRIGVMPDKPWNVRCKITP